MFKSLVKIAGATLLFAGIHSLLATRAAKRKASGLLGERNRNALYRPFYNIQAVLTFGALIFYAVKLPDRELYRVRGPVVGLMRFGQLYFLLFMMNGARQIGFLNFAGVPNLVSYFKGQSEIQAEPEGQGPVRESGMGPMKVTGPFRFSRHPLNFGMMPVLWLMPRMTLNLAAFNLITSVYLVIGSAHEEKRLREAYGPAYEEYQRSGINFFLPSIPSLSLPGNSD